MLNQCWQQLHSSVSVVELRQPQMELKQPETDVDTGIKYYFNASDKSKGGRGRRGRPGK